MFFVIEGIDGVGKSSVIDELGTQLCLRRPVLPSSRLKAYKVWTDRFATPKTHYRFYQLCMFDLSEEVRSLCYAGEHVVLDRYWYSTVATHRMLGVECNCSDFSQLVRPDLVVHLTAREDVRKDRMAKRGLDANDIRLLDAGGELLRHFGEVLPPDTREIDTTSLDVAQTAGRIRKFLKEGGGL